MANAKGVPYVTLNNEIKKKARMMHESGKSLISISDYLRIDYGTLRNVASKEGWVKGKRKVLLESRSLYKSFEEAEQDLAKVKEYYANERLTSHKRYCGGYFSSLRASRSRNFKIYRENSMAVRVPKF